MSDPTVSFIAVATPGYYYTCAVEFGKELMARTSLRSVRFNILPGREGPWPLGTISRPAVMLENWPQIVALGADYVFCVDADMRVDGTVGDEILGEIVGTEHPGYVGHHPTTIPYDRNPISRAFIQMGDGERYYAGGFFGGERDAVWDMLDEMAHICDPEAPTPRFHDESALNKCFLATPPTRVLSPAYCHPDRNDYYRDHVWTQEYERIIVALDKPDEIRGHR